MANNQNNEINELKKEIVELKSIVEELRTATSDEPTRSVNLSMPEFEPVDRSEKKAHSSSEHHHHSSDSEHSHHHSSSHHHHHHSSSGSHHHHSSGSHHHHSEVRADNAGAVKSEANAKFSKVEKAATEPKKSRKKYIVLGVILAILVACAGVALYVVNAYQEAMKEDTADAAPETPVYTDEELGIDPAVAERLDGYRCIAIYGLDNTKRSDVILIMCIDKETHLGRIFTVYRDTYMQLNPNEVYSFRNGEQDLFKCNHSYKKGGMIASLNMLNRHLDLNIRECIGLNWEAISSIVDQLDGIDVYMNYELCLFVNKGLSDEEQIDYNGGHQHLNGKQAVKYLRTRKDPGSTAVTRSNRNLAVFLDLFERAKTMDKEDVLDIFTASIGKCETNMKLKSMIKMLKDIRSYELLPSDGWPYRYSILWDDAFYYYVPDDLESNVSDMHAKLFGESGYEPTETCKSLNDMIQEDRKSLF